MALRPLTQQQVITAFGSPLPYIRDDGHVDPAWERLTLAYATLPAPLPMLGQPNLKVTRIRCHHRLTEIFTAVYAELHANAAAWSSIGDYGGCYNFRVQRRASVLSRHCWGICVDQDCADNPFGRAPNVNADVVRIFEKHGFAWGGNFGRGRTDGMHFEFADLAMLRAAAA